MLNVVDSNKKKKHVVKKKIKRKNLFFFEGKRKNLENLILEQHVKKISPPPKL